MTTIQWHEVQANMSLLPLDMHEVLADGVTLGPTLQFQENGEAPVPGAPSILPTSTMTTATTATINWSAPSAGSPVTGYEVFRDGILFSTPGPTVLTSNVTGVPNDSADHTFSVRAVGANGAGPFDSVILNFVTPPVPPPPTPTNFARGTLSPTSVPVTWAQADPPGGNPALASFNIRHGAGALLRSGISATVRATTITGLTEQTTYSGVFIEAVDTAGRTSSPSNQITFTTPNGTNPTQHDPVMGVPNNDEADELVVTSWPACRTYDYSGVIGDISSFGSRVLGVTGSLDGGVIQSGANGSALATAAENLLINVYEGAGSAARQNVEIRIAIGNEADRDFTTGTSVPANYINAYSLLRQVVHQTVTGGARRFPNATVAVDLTQRQIRTGGSGPRFKPIARYLDVFASSMYCPGRDLSVNRPNRPDFQPYADYLDEVFEVLADWRATGGVGGTSLAGQLNQFATWEFGIPIDHANFVAADSGTNPPFDPTNGEPTANTNFSIRPRYCAGGIDSDGTNWVGFLQYVYNKCDAMGVRMREQIYWNQQSNGDIPNRFPHDRQPRTTPDTERAWRNWTPGSRLPNA